MIVLQNAVRLYDKTDIYMKEYNISNTSGLFMALLKNKKIEHKLTDDGKRVKVYLYCDTDLLELGQTYQLVVNSIDK